MPRVSIGLPVYNGEPFLRQALDALLAQTEPDLEIIVSDNASPDATVAIVQEYAARDPRVRLTRNERNLGAAYNYNKVFDLATGEYFKWASADDLIAPTFVERCLAALEAAPSAVLAYPRTVIIDEQGAVSHHYADELELRQPTPAGRYAAFHARFRNLRECNAVFGLIRTGALRRTRLIDSFSSSDIVLLAELALLGQFAEVPEDLFFRRDHQKSSIRANPDARKRAAWFDPRRAGSRFPKWRIGREFLRSINRLGPGGAERLRCYAALFGWYRWNRKRLAREVRQAGAEWAQGLPAPIRRPVRAARRALRGK